MTGHTSLSQPMGDRQGNRRAAVAPMRSGEPADDFSAVAALIEIAGIMGEAGRRLRRWVSIGALIFEVCRGASNSLLGGLGRGRHVRLGASVCVAAYVTAILNAGRSPPACR